MKGFKPFNKVDDFYKDVWSLLRNPGKRKAEIKNLVMLLIQLIINYPKFKEHVSYIIEEEHLRDWLTTGKQ